MPEGVDFQYLYEGEFLTIHTGLIVKLPPGYSLKIHPQSLIGADDLLSFIYCEAIVDTKFSDELIFKLYRFENKYSEDENCPIVIWNESPVARGELVKKEPTFIKEIHERPHFKGKRNGKFGSSDK